MADLFSILSSGLVPIKGALPEGHLRSWIPPGPEGTAQTIEPMQRLVSQAKLELMQNEVTRAKRVYRLRKTIRQIIDSCPPKDYYCYAKKLYEFCRDQIKYAFDPNGVELIEHPEHVLESGLADCDSNVILLATMYEAIGLPARFVTVKGDPRHPEEYSHVYLQVKIPRHGWVGADPIMPDRQFGWEPDTSLPRKTWPASLDKVPGDGDESEQDDGTTGAKGMDDLGGLGGLGGLEDLGQNPPMTGLQTLTAVMFMGAGMGVASTVMTKASSKTNKGKLYMLAGALGGAFMYASMAKKILPPQFVYTPGGK
jgi:hypothetical protein